MRERENGEEGDRARLSARVSEGGIERERTRSIYPALLKAEGEPTIELVSGHQQKEWDESDTIHVGRHLSKNKLDEPPFHWVGGTLRFSTRPGDQVQNFEILIYQGELVSSVKIRFAQSR